MLLERIALEQMVFFKEEAGRNLSFEWQGTAAVKDDDMM
jgi:hypothetical protein